MTVTSFLYVERTSLIPAIIATATYLPFYCLFYGGLVHSEYFCVTTPIFFIISISIGYAGFRIIEWKKSEKRRNFLQILLRQDLRSKCQTIHGYLQMLEDADLSEEEREYLRKAVKTGREAGEILGLARELRKIEGTERVTEKDILKVLEKVMNDISDLVDRKEIKIEENYPKSIGKFQGDYSINTLFSQLLKTRIQTSECDKIRINTEEREEDLLVKVEDNGKKLSEDVKKLFSGEVYTGETTGVGGARYHMLREIAEHIDAEIKSQDSELGGARFDIHLVKA